MCEYCGCQELPVIGELTREHERVLNLITGVRAARDSGDLPGMAAAARQVAAVLGPHTMVEEQSLFPALAADFPAQIAALEAEHRQIDAVLREAAGGLPADPGWPARLGEAMAVLRGHIFAEQDGVFPAALASLSAADWDAAEAARARSTGRGDRCPTVEA
jgi:Hemerythrin HHE cation binding domain